MNGRIEAEFEGKEKDFIGKVNENLEFYMLHWSGLCRWFKDNSLNPAEDPEVMYSLTGCNYKKGISNQEAESSPIDLKPYLNNVILVRGKLARGQAEKNVHRFWICEAKVLDTGGIILSEICESLTDLMYDLKGHPHKVGSGGGRKPSW